MSKPLGKGTITCLNSIFVRYAITRIWHQIYLYQDGTKILTLTQLHVVLRWWVNHKNTINKYKRMGVLNSCGRATFFLSEKERDKRDDWGFGEKSIYNWFV